MKTIQIAVYGVEIQPDSWNEPTWVYVGIIDDELTLEIVIDSWLDAKLYYNLTTEEFANLKVGDELDEGTRVLSINYEPDYESISYKEFEYANV